MFSKLIGTDSRTLLCFWSRQTLRYVSSQCSITPAGWVRVCPCAQEGCIVSDALCLWTVHVVDVVSAQVFSKCSCSIFTRLVVNSSTYLNWKVHPGTATPGFSRELLSARNCFAKLTCFHPHRCAHKMHSRGRQPDRSCWRSALRSVGSMISRNRTSSKSQRAAEGHHKSRRKTNNKAQSNRWKNTESPCIKTQRGSQKETWRNDRFNTTALKTH